jgi:predicted lipid-binding transport protein (Tim44 family)
MVTEGFEKIRSEVVAAGGIKCFKMQQLRDASPYKKLGPGVNQEISQALQQKGLGHSELGMYQEENVYVFEQASNAARLINSIIGGASDDGAKAILDAVAPDTQTGAAEAKLADVRALLVQLQDVFNEGEAA